MVFTCLVEKLPHLMCFEQAQKFFNTTAPLKGNGMAKTERPMHPDRGGAYKKYRVGEVTVSGRKAYDLILFDTPVVRYFEPNLDGTRHVSIRYYNSSSTKKFVDRHGWRSGKRFNTPDGRDAILYLAHSPHQPSAFLTLDSNNKLILDRSWHLSFCKYFASEEDKQQRKDFKRILESLFDVLYVQEHGIREHARGDGLLADFVPYYGNASTDVSKYVNAIMHGPDADAMLDPNTIPTLLRHAGNAFERVCDKEAWKLTDKVKFSDYFERNKWKKNKKLDLISTANVKPAVIKVRDMLLRNAGFMNRSDVIELPQFPEHGYKGTFYRYAKRDRYTEEYLLDHYKKD